MFRKYKHLTCGSAICGVRQLLRPLQKASTSIIKCLMWLLLKQNGLFWPWFGNFRSRTGKRHREGLNRGHRGRSQRPQLESGLEKEKGAEEMTVLVTCLPHKCKDLSLITRTHKIPGVVAHTYNQSDGEMGEEMWPVELTVHLPFEILDQLDTLSQSEGTRDCLLTLTCVYTHGHTCTILTYIPMCAHRERGNEWSYHVFKTCFS